MSDRELLALMASVLVAADLHRCYQPNWAKDSVNEAQAILAEVDKQFSPPGERKAQ